MLRNATSISLALDESRYRKIVRFQADVPSRAVDAQDFCHAGVLGILACEKGHASEFEEGHAVTAVKQLDSFSTRFCTPLGPRRGPMGQENSRASGVR